MPFAEFKEQAEALLREDQSRVTTARVVVLACLLEADHALTHGEVEARMQSEHQIDRVTVYRVLDWLRDRGLAHRIAGDDRVWRFNAETQPAHSGSHPHFHCNTCGDVICLDETSKLAVVPLPAGFRRDAFEFTVKGLCPACARPSKSGPRARTARR